MAPRSATLTAVLALVCALLQAAAFVPTPPELSWSAPDATTGYRSATLTLTSGDYLSALASSATCKLTSTILVNGGQPAPTLVMARCGRYNLTLVNKLTVATNIHLHGMHVSSVAPGDDPMRSIAANTTASYLYNVPCNHAGGTHWYHAHLHGSTAPQVPGGLAGMLIVSEDPAEVPATAPQTYLNVMANSTRQHSLVIAKYGMARSGCPSGTSTYLVNGKLSPTLTGLTAGVWHRVRVVLVDASATGTTITVAAVGSSAVCSYRLIGLDGVTVSPALRTISGLFSGPMSRRTDVLLNCPTAGASAYSLNVGTTIIAYFTVGAGVSPAQAAPATFKPCRPSYLQPIPTPATVDLTMGGISLGGQGMTAPVATVQLNQTYQWEISGSKSHPFHLHLNHYQLISPVQGFAQAEDWLDSGVGGSSLFFKIRPDAFTGKMWFHCHVLGHEDNGAIGYATVAGTGGVDAADAAPADIANPFTC